jgi:hypothetical protein
MIFTIFIIFIFRRHQKLSLCCRMMRRGGERERARHHVNTQFEVRLRLRAMQNMTKEGNLHSFPRLRHLHCIFLKTARALKTVIAQCK